MNGRILDAARHIRRIAPDSKILFVSENHSWDIVEGALQLGAGYVLKWHEDTELLPAVELLLQGKQFVSAFFGRNDFGNPSTVRTSQNKEVVLTVPTQKTETKGGHEAGFYEDDRSLQGLKRFIGAALKRGNAAVVVASASHQDSLISRLQTYGVGSMVQTAMKDAKGTSPRVAVFGEGAPLLWARGNAEAAIQPEKLSNQLTNSYDVDILCGYSLATVQNDLNGTVFPRICTAHSTVRSP